MYPRSKFQEILLAIREEMAREADFDVDLFVEMVRSGARRKETHGLYSIADSPADTAADQVQRSLRPRGKRKA